MREDRWAPCAERRTPRLATHARVRRYGRVLAVAVALEDHRRDVAADQRAVRIAAQGPTIVAALWAMPWDRLDQVSAHRVAVGSRRDCDEQRQPKCHTKQDEELDGGLAAPHARTVPPMRVRASDAYDTQPRRRARDAHGSARPERPRRATSSWARQAL